MQLKDVKDKFQAAYAKIDKFQNDKRNLEQEILRYKGL